MSDDKKKTGTADRTRINVNEPYELAYWRKELNVSEKKLREAVAAAGVTVAAVRAYLQKK